MVWSTLETRHWRLWIFLVFLLPLGYGLALALGASADFANSLSTASRMPFLYDKPVGEDGFYMLGVAWNLAEGRGLVGNFDQPVTGVQPLATLIYAALAWLVQSVSGGRDEFIRLVIAFGVVNLAVFAHLVGRLAARYADDAVSGRALYALAVILVCTSFYLFRVFTYGLETGIYLTVLILVLRHYFALSDAVNESNRFPLRRSVHFGFWVGLAGLARIDFGVLYFFFLLRCYRQNKPLLPALILAGAIASVVVAPWFLHVYQVSGTILPSSGPAQAGLISWDQVDGRLLAMMSALIQNLMPIIYVGDRWFTALAAFLLLMAVIVWSRSKKIKIELHGLRDWLWPMICLLVVYFLFFWSTHFYTRYFSPIVIPAIIGLSLLVGKGLSRVRLQKGFLIVFLMGLMTFATFAFASLHRGTIFNEHFLSAGYINRYASDRVVGVFNSGVAGFINPNVVNLDGKVNMEILPYVENGRIDGYLDRHPEITMILDWSKLIRRRISEEHLDRNWVECVDGSAWYAVGYCRKLPE